MKKPDLDVNVIHQKTKMDKKRPNKFILMLIQEMERDLYQERVNNSSEKARAGFIAGTFMRMRKYPFNKK